MSKLRKVVAERVQFNRIVDDLPTKRAQLWHRVDTKM
jgi:hypothetical protein